MQFIKKYGFLILTMIFMLIGFLTLKFSVDFGSRAASAYLISMGGSMDSADFNAIKSKYIISHMIIGGILFSLGTIFLFFSLYKLSKENS
ncbi:hypothetical protein KD050_18660 [Psychrobacillus sp. INOP01]|uniref:hypothetical protein n=1 Tax=Psychrobacillus sp. INOP01 TaxID=2829187 RepID=UPI001BA6DE6B|nr:hypothetical protein [Psychrobacillus sp. INOP01]QUG41273.1 hypothetical protein KD050_18660 [Psychrobacillus sp. INOP01]